ncbi:MAG: hypothetical protein K2H74_05605 [Paramuribaculum sp.]|nr:hypothetical protein [Paramuribaculum sp.]
MVTTGSITGSRADSQGHAETDSEFRDFEDGVDIGDLGIFIFAKIAGTPSDEKLVYKLTNLLESDDARIEIVGSNGNYFVNLMIRKDDLKDVLDGYEITAQGNSIVSFRFLILANCSTSGMNTTAMWDAITGQTFSSVIAQLGDWSYPMSDIYNADGGPGVESIYSKDNNYIPMFGTNVFAATEADLVYSTPGGRVYLGAVNLLRSLAKVKVVDNIQNKDALGYPCITSVEILSSQDQAMILPAGALNYEDGQQVHNPNMFEDNSDLTLAGTYKLGVVPEEWTITPSSQRTGNVFMGFVPEQTIGHPNNNFDEGMPVLHITIANRKADTSMESHDFYVPMTSYNGVNFTFGQNILRNHIYTLSINDFGAMLNIQVDLVPYRSCVLEPFFGLDRD